MSTDLYFNQFHFIKIHIVVFLIETLRSGWQVLLIMIVSLLSVMTFRRPDTSEHAFLSKRWTTLGSGISFRRLVNLDHSECATCLVANDPMSSFHFRVIVFIMPGHSIK
ncbi:hypothetical protein CDAR_52711 [Caerostris darwini]|uniref:Uncharacterized protein n=1 Tax=Caerostris darwini TaxID=1538125 RepID=A0AAV4T419_9ARAC|nr:hypothetical protein CDAR_52711 [Caerostris darwini]